MQFRHPESYRILSDGRILQDPMGSGVGYVDLDIVLFLFQNKVQKKNYNIAKNPMFQIRLVKDDICKSK